MEHEAKRSGIRTCAACSERKVQEKTVGNETMKQVVFEIVRFREYQ